MSRPYPDWYGPGYHSNARWLIPADRPPATPHADDSGRTVTPLYGPKGDVIAQVSDKPWVPCGFQRTTPTKGHTL